VTTPVTVKIPRDALVTAISAPSDDSLALTTKGQVLAWGDNTFGELGNGSTAALGTDLPVRVKLATGLAATALGGGRSAGTRQILTSQGKYPDVQRASVQPGACAQEGAHPADRALGNRRPARPGEFQFVITRITHASRAKDRYLQQKAQGEYGGRLPGGLVFRASRLSQSQSSHLIIIETSAAGSCPCSCPVTARNVGGDLGVAFVCAAAPEWSGGWVG
jgi:hypothetical protein